MSDSASTPVVRRGGRRGTIIWIGVIAIAALLCWWLKGPAAVELAWQNFLSQLLVLIPRMSAALLISGFIQVLVPRGLVTKWLGTGAGLKGLMVAAMVGALTPGGPMLAFPLVVVLRNSGASTIALITFLTAWATLGFHRILMWELPLMGPEFAFVRYVSSLPLALIAGLTAMGVIWLSTRRKADRS